MLGLLVCWLGRVGPAGRNSSVVHVVITASSIVTPSPSIHRRSAYTVLGFVGYLVGTVVATTLAFRWQLSLGERLVAILVPPLAFLAVTTVATALKGREWIVFYQVVVGAMAATWVAGLGIGADLPRLFDVTVLGISTFLVFGRIGCFHVACCHGRPARRGVVYDERHVAVGLWTVCAHRPLVPVQLFEAAGAAVLLGVSLLASSVPGRAACVFVLGYAVMRFLLEHVRGDPARPTMLGMSEARWWCVASAAGCVIVRPSWWALAAAGLLSAGAAAVITTRRWRELLEPAHVRDLDDVCMTILADPQRGRRQTTLGVAVSCHELPDGRLDWVWSSSHVAWSPIVATALARALWPTAEIVAGRTPGIVHVVVASIGFTRVSPSGRACRTGSRRPWT